MDGVFGDREFERALAESAPAGDEAPGDVKRLVRDLRDAYPRDEIDPSVETAHLAAMAEAARTLRGASPLPPPPSRARWDVKRRLLRSPVGKVAAVLVAMFTIFSGVALAGVLPAPVQRAVAHVASSVGIHLPAPLEEGPASDDQGEDGDDQGQDEDSQGEAPQPAADDLSKPSNDPSEGGSGDQGDENDQGEDGDHQGENGDDQGDENDQGDPGTDQGDNQGDENDQGGDNEGDQNDQGDNNHDQGDGDDQGDGSGGSGHESDGHQGSGGDQGNQGDHGGDDHSGDQGDQGGDEGGSGD